MPEFFINIYGMTFMSIENFPVQLQAAIQQGFLAREFENGLKSRLGFRQVADREIFPTLLVRLLPRRVRV